MAEIKDYNLLFGEFDSSDKDIVKAINEKGILGLMLDKVSKTLQPYVNDSSISKQDKVQIISSLMGSAINNSVELFLKLPVAKSQADSFKAQTKSFSVADQQKVIKAMTDAYAVLLNEVGTENLKMPFFLFGSNDLNAQNMHLRPTNLGTKKNANMQIYNSIFIEFMYNCGAIDEKTKDAMIGDKTFNEDRVSIKLPDGT